MTLEEIKDYLKIDDTYEDNFLTELIEVSQIYIDSCVGEYYKTDTKAVKLANLLQKKLISDMYENRSTEVPANTKQDRIVTSILDKLSNYIDETVV
jgi:uncharacterized phage protein (predicted DNA packaging)